MSERRIVSRGQIIKGLLILPPALLLAGCGVDSGACSGTTSASSDTPPQRQLGIGSRIVVADSTKPLVSGSCEFAIEPNSLNVNNPLTSQTDTPELKIVTTAEFLVGNTLHSVGAINGDLAELEKRSGHVEFPWWEFSKKVDPTACNIISVFWTNGRLTRVLLNSQVPENLMYPKDVL